MHDGDGGGVRMSKVKVSVSACDMIPRGGEKSWTWAAATTVDNDDDDDDALPSSADCLEGPSVFCSSPLLLLVSL